MDVMEELIVFFHNESAFLRNGMKCNSTSFLLQDFLVDSSLGS